MISNNEIIITPISNKEFKIENIHNSDDKGELSLGIDLTKLHKKLSGLAGNGIVYQNIGNTNTTFVEIIGEEEVSEDSMVTYTATPSMKNYAWKLTGGEIIESSDHTVTVKWIEKGEQTINLSYTTPNQCNKETSKVINVSETLGVIDIDSNSKSPLTLVPIPNNGKFTIYTKGVKGIFTLSIIDMNGKVVYQEEDVNIFNDFSKSIDMKVKSSGVYILIIHNSSVTYKSRFLIK